jgi:hypothetical protein
MDDLDWLRSLAGHGLPGAAPLPPAPVSDAMPAAVAGHRLSGVLAAAVADGSMEVEADDRARIARAHEDAMREALLLEEELLRASEVLATAGIDHRVLKGAALAHMIHPDPAERCFGDNDVLVAAGDIDAAVGALLEAGARRPVPALSSTFDRRFAKSVTLHWTGGTELDLHRTLAPGPYGFLVVLDDLFRDPVEVILAGRVIPTLPADLHLIHGAVHVALGDTEPRLGNVRDVALLAAGPSVDLDHIIATVERWQCAAPVAMGLRATRTLGHHRSPVEEWAEAYTISETDRRRLECYSDREGRFRRQARASMSVLGWRDRIAFARALLRPSAANRSARSGSVPR